MKYLAHSYNRRKRNFFLFMHITAFCMYMILILVAAILRIMLKEKDKVIDSLREQTQWYKETPIAPISDEYREWWDKDDYIWFIREMRSVTSLVL